MAWEEAQYVVDEVLGGIKAGQITGIPPRNMVYFSVRRFDSGSLMIVCTIPEDTIIDGQLLCTVAGVKVVRKVASPPIGVNDGDVVMNVIRGQANATIIDSGLTNGVTYYYGFFPYSDHGVYNYNQENIISIVPREYLIWAFDQNFSDKNPTTTITYPEGFDNFYYGKMYTNEDGASYGSIVTSGGWLTFLQRTLKNFPFMVNKQGEAVYALDPNDYTKKMDGTPSDYNNLNFDGGAFAWLNKIYMREDYSSDGNSRRVQFSNYKLEGFNPVGFLDPDGNELDGVWLPMGYMDASGRTLIAGTTPVASKTTAQEKSIIDGFSSRGVFLGGPIMNVLRDLEYMLFKSTNIQFTAGYGRCNAGNNAVIANQVVENGSVPGWKGSSDKKTMNKYFHSQLLGSYQQWIRDPYTILINGKLKMSDRYIYDLTGAQLLDLVHYNSSNAWIYPSYLVKAPNTIGSRPSVENTGSTSTGLCDGLYTNAAGAIVALRLGNCNNDLTAGPAALNLGGEASYAGWDVGVGLLLLPPAGYAPGVARMVQTYPNEEGIP